jgi:hypothetical protein
MSYAPTASNDENQQLDQNRSAPFRLSDTESIASGRLQVEGDGSLKDALAGIGANGSPGNEVDRLTDRIEAAQWNLVPAPAEPQLPFLFEPEGQTQNGEPSNLALLGLREWGEARAQVAAELSEIQSQPLFLQDEARQVDGGTHWQRAERDAEPYHPAKLAPLLRDLPAGFDALLRQPASESVIETALPDAGIATATSETIEPAPIADAFDAATKLAADADAAAVALENLTRLLHNHQHVVSAMPPPRELPQRDLAPGPTSTLPVHLLQREVPRPTAASQRTARAASGPVARAASPPALRSVPTPNDRRQFDLRGFIAGFALSWALGAVLYIYLMVG